MASPDVRIAPRDYINGSSMPERVIPWCFFLFGWRIFTMEERFMSLTEAAKYVPTTNGRKVSSQSLWRWCSKGMQGQKLRHYRFGKRIVVTMDDLLEFGRAVAAARVAEMDEQAGKVSAPRTRTRTEAQRETAIAQAEQKLRERGVL